ncbi:MAG: hypothetical protein WCS43_09685 [Verrucomicrobiota bacterium]
MKSREAFPIKSITLTASRFPCSAFIRSHRHLLASRELQHWAFRQASELDHFVGFHLINPYEVVADEFVADLAEGLEIGGTSDLCLIDELSPVICRHPNGRFCVIMPKRVALATATVVKAETEKAA